MEANLSVKTNRSEASFLLLKHENSHILKASPLSFILQCACSKLPFRPFLSTEVPPIPTSQWGPPNDFLYRDTTWYHRQQPAVQQQIQLCRKFVFFSYELFLWTCVLVDTYDLCLPEQLHQDFKVHPAYIPASQPLWTIPKSGQFLLLMPLHLAGGNIEICLKSSKHDENNAIFAFSLKSAALEYWLLWIPAHSWNFLSFRRDNGSALIFRPHTDSHQIWIWWYSKWSILL